MFTLFFTEINIELLFKQKNGDKKYVNESELPRGEGLTEFEIDKWNFAWRSKVQQEEDPLLSSLVVIIANFTFVNYTL